jgi:hypothetical protein
MHLSENRNRTKTPSWRQTVVRVNDRNAASLRFGEKLIVVPYRDNFRSRWRAVLWGVAALKHAHLMPGGELRGDQAAQIHADSTGAGETEDGMGDVQK